MAVSLITGNTGSGNSASPTVTIPNGSSAAQAGDTIVVWVGVSSTGLTITVPSGWTNPLGGTTDVESDAHFQCCLVHVVTAGEAGTTVWTLTNLFAAAQGYSIVGHRYRGADGTTPVMAAASTFSSANSANPHVIAGIAAGSITESGALVCSCIAVDAGSRTHTTPSGWTTAGNVVIACSQSSFTRDTTTTSGVAVAATNVTPSTGDEYSSITLALRQAPPPTITTVWGGWTATAVGYAAGAEVASNDGTSTTPRGIIPYNTAVGDVLLAILTVDAADAGELTNPTSQGWTLRNGVVGADINISTLTKTWDGDDTAPEWTLDTEHSWTVDVYRIPSGYIYDTGSTNTQASSLSIAPSVTPTTTNSHVISFVANNQSGVQTPWSSDLGTEILDRKDVLLNRQLVDYTTSSTSAVTITHTKTGLADALAAVIISFKASGPANVPGAIASNWGAWTATAVGVRATAGIVATAWSGWTATAVGTRQTFGTITTAWGGWTATATGAPSRAGTIASNWGAWTATAAATVSRRATVTQSWGGWTATATATRATFGAVATSWGGWTATAAGVVAHVATVTTTWGGWTATAIGHRVWPGTITSAWGGWTATAVGQTSKTGVIATTWGGWTATGSATVTHHATVTQSWGGWTATAVGLVSHSGAITTAWAGWTATGSATVEHRATITTAWAQGSSALDNFNRADTTSPVGAGGVGLGSGWNAPGWMIQSNRAKKDGGQDDANFLTDIGTMDHYVEFDVVGTVGVQNPAYTVLHARVNESTGLAQNAVIGYIDPGGSKRATIARYQGGSFAEIAFGTTGLDISGTYKLRLECQGGEARLYHNGSLVCTADISTLTNLGSYGGMAAQNSSPPVDDYKVGPLVGGWSATAVGTVDHPATIVSNWGGWTATAVGSTEGNVAGSITSNWGTWTATAVGVRATAGTITTSWGAWTATANGSRTTFGAITTVWAGWTATAVGIVGRVATVTTVWGGWTATAGGVISHQATITTAWGGWSATAVGSTEGNVVGSITTIWGGWTATAVAVRSVAASITTSWGGWAATAVGTRVIVAEVSTVWAGWTATGAGTRETFAASDTAWPGWTATAVGARGLPASSETNWGGWTATAIGVVFGTLVIVGELRAWRVDPYRTAVAADPARTGWRVDPYRTAIDVGSGP